MMDNNIVNQGQDEVEAVPLPNHSTATAGIQFTYTTS